MITIKILHHIPGRIRLKVSVLYKSQEIEKILQEKIKSITSIIDAYPNHITGNILIYYKTDTPSDQILNELKELLTNITQKNNYRVITKAPPKSITDFISINPSEILSYFKLIKDFTAPTSKIKQQKIPRKEDLIEGKEEQKAILWHTKEINEIISYFNTNKEKGLSQQEAEYRLKKYGSNVLPEAVPRSKLDIFLDQLKSLPVGLLAIAAGVSLFTGGIVDAIAIICVIFLNATIGFVTESQSEKTINSLKGLVRPTAWVLRDGVPREIGAEYVVPGDIILLKPGDYVPADARLIQAKRLNIDESALTGEGVPVTKDPSVITDASCPICDRHNMCYMGTLVTGGQGVAIVVSTGRFTEMGAIQALVGKEKPPETPLEKQLEDLGTKLVLITGSICLLVFATGIFRGYGFLQMLKTAISLAVAAVPEGLPTVATTTLSLGVREMRRHKVLVRHLSAIEALGSVQIICLDKTGTITENKMKVVQIRTYDKILNLPEELKNYESETITPEFTEELMGILIVCALCNESEIVREGDGFKLHGTPTENALLMLALTCGINIPQLREDWPREKIIHRSERRNYMATIHNVYENKKLVCIKGSPREVLNLCTHYMKDGKIYDLTKDDDLYIQTQNEQMAGEALRVLGIAYALSDVVPNLDEREDDDQVTKGLIWLGLVGMTDPIRPGLKELFPKFHQAGIKTVMITGDQSPTAFAVGKTLNISGSDELVILDASNIVDMDPVALKALALKTSVFSRVSPANKLEIVKALQASDKVVAMTGDGINDSPALRAANIGIAMGNTGTDVAREVSDIILEDDNLETLIVAIKMGRTIYGNVQKSLRFLLSTNLAEIMVSFIANTAGLGQPLTEMQLLWINLVTDIFPGLALSMEAPEPDIMNRPPRDPHKPILDKEDFLGISKEAGLISLSTLASYGYGLMRYGISPNASAMSFISLTASQLLHAYTCRSKNSGIFKGEKLPRNPYLDLAIGGTFALQVLAFFIPGLRNLLGLTGIAPTDVLVASSSAIVPFLINELTKNPEKREVG